MLKERKSILLQIDAAAVLWKKYESISSCVKTLCGTVFKNKNNYVPETSKNLTSGIIDGEQGGMMPPWQLLGAPLAAERARFFKEYRLNRFSGCVVVSSKARN